MADMQTELNRRLNHRTPGTPPYHWGKRDDGTDVRHHGTADPGRCERCGGESRRSPDE